MFELFVVILVFCIILFLYIHIYDNYNTSNDLEVYELERVSKEKLEEVCNLKQPFIFNYDEAIVQNTDLYRLDDHYQTFDLNIRKNETEDEPATPEDTDDDVVPLPVEEALALFKRDTTQSYFTEFNQDFLIESGIVKHIKYNDGYLRPPLVSNCIYDVLSGSSNSHTPLRYDINYRNYYLSTHGKVEVILIPPKYSKYLYPQYDYELFEFKSPINVWNVQPRYRADYNKTKHIQVSLYPGKVLYIPPSWWYSIKFYKKASITTMKYRTIMNNVSISPQLFMHFLQLYNVKRNTIENIKTGKSSVEKKKDSSKSITPVIKKELNII
jgi:hypothetical protein